jgi:hypothetical protein
VLKDTLQGIKTSFTAERDNGLYLDLNGAEKGFGGGGMVAKIDDCPDKKLINIVSAASAMALYF